jgi:hypothetical protein
MADKAQAGVLEAQRKQSAVTILAPMFDALRRFRKSQGRLLLEYIRNYISDGRLMRITGPQGEAQYIPLVKAPDSVEYDVVVDQSPTSPDFREKTWSAIQSLLPVMLKTGHPIPPSVFDASPLPIKVAEEFKQMSQKQIPPEIKAQFDAMQQQMQKMGQEIQSLSQENQMLKSDKTLDAVKLEQKADKDAASLQQRYDQMNLNADLEKFKTIFEAQNERVLVEMDNRFKALIETLKPTKEGANA